VHQIKNKTYKIVELNAKRKGINWPTFRFLVHYLGSALVEPLAALKLKWYQNN
jgi:hypothetical protein